MDFEDVRFKGFSKRIKLNDALKLSFQVFPQFSMEKIHIGESSLSKRVLREDVYASRSIPPFDRSAVDGYAVRAQDTIGASENNPLILKVIDTLEIGQVSKRQIEERTAIQIPTGGVVPEGADSVIMIEDTSIISERSNEIEIYTSLPRGKNIAKAGEDLKKSDLILKKGRLLRSVDKAFLLSAGVTQITVSKVPKIAILSTGDELVSALTPNIELGKIPDTNSINLYEFCKEDGWNPRNLGIIRDDEESLRKTIEDATDEYDVVLLSGGSSVGKKDFIPKILNELGQLFFHGIAMRPGGPIAAALINNRIVFGLPGFPTATLIGYQFIVQPIVFSSMGLNPKYSYITLEAEITRNVGSKLGRLDFLRVRLEKTAQGKMVAVPIEIGGSGLLRSIVHGNGIIKIPESSEGLKRGDKVHVIILDSNYVDLTHLSTS